MEGKTHTVAFVDVSLGLSFVLCMIRNWKIMCSKAVECLQKLKGSTGDMLFNFFSSSLFRERKRRRWRDNMNEWTRCNVFLGHRGSFLSCMAYAWNISPRGDQCVCAVHQPERRWARRKAHSERQRVFHILTSGSSPLSGGWKPVLTNMWSHQTEIGIMGFWGFF